MSQIRMFEDSPVKSTPRKLSELRGRDLPQLDRLSDVVSLIRDSKAFGTRQQKYAESAARILGLLDAGGQPTVEGLTFKEASGHDDLTFLAEAFVRSKVGSTWLKSAGCSRLRDLPANSALKMLRDHADIADSTARRRSQTLEAWRGYLAPAATQHAGASQLPLDDSASAGSEEWPAGTSVLHNEGGARVAEQLAKDFATAPEVLIVTGYASLFRVLELVQTASATTSLRILFGNEPYTSAADEARLSGCRVDAAMRRHWLERGLSVAQCAAPVVAKERIDSGMLDIRIAAGKPQHSKMYVTPYAVTVGSSNFTRPGLQTQSEANTRHTSGRHFKEARQLAEGYWNQGEPWNDGFAALLDALIQPTTWQEALAHACAMVLGGEWARDYMTIDSGPNKSLWNHQRDGLALGLHILFTRGSVLVADAAGSGKTRLGTWLLRGMSDHMVRMGEYRPAYTTAFVPPGVQEDWDSELRYAHQHADVHSSGRLSAAMGEASLESLSRSEILLVDEAHNFVNNTKRTNKIRENNANSTLLFTATPINRDAGDLQALVGLLGADHFEDETLKALRNLFRLKRRGGLAADSDDVEIVRRELAQFMVRRTRTELNRLAACEPERVGVPRPRYPEMNSRYYELPVSEHDEKLMKELHILLGQLTGIGRFGKAISQTARQKNLEKGQEQILAGRVKSTAALARHTVLDCLRSSRAAALEHILGQEEALRQLGLDLKGEALSTPESGCIGSLLARAGKLPRWSLEPSLKAKAPSWVVDEGEHRSTSHAEVEIYRRIAATIPKLSADREGAKVEKICRIHDQHERVLAFEDSRITLALMRWKLEQRGIDCVLLHGDSSTAERKRAKARLGVDATGRVVALCSDAFAEGFNLQGASAVIHLDLPTVLRLAEQRTGRIDRMNSKHKSIDVWWPNDPSVYQLRSGDDVLRIRNRITRKLIGANLELPDESVTTEEVVRVLDEVREQVETDDSLFDAFQPVRDLQQHFVPDWAAEAVRGTEARVSARVCTVSSAQRWAFFVVGRDLPRWVFIPSLEDQPIMDVSKIRECLALRLRATIPSGEMTPQVSGQAKRFARALGQREDSTLTPVYRRARRLAEKVWDPWLRDAEQAGDVERTEYLRQLCEALGKTGNDTRLDPCQLLDRWRKCLQPYRTRMREEKGVKELFTMDDLERPLLDSPLDTRTLARLLAGIAPLEPVENRIRVAILGMPDGSRA